MKNYEQHRIRSKTCLAIRGLEPLKVEDVSDVAVSKKRKKKEKSLETGEDGLVEDAEKSQAKLKKEIRAKAKKEEKVLVDLKCEHCGKEYKTQTGIKNHTTKGCKQKPLSPEEIERLRLEAKMIHDQKMREELIRSKRPILISYFDIMINSGRTERAWQEFKKMKEVEDNQALLDAVEIYDIILRGFARSNQVRCRRQTADP